MENDSPEDRYTKFTFLSKSPTQSNKRPKEKKSETWDNTEKKVASDIGRSRLPNCLAERGNEDHCRITKKENIGPSKDAKTPVRRCWDQKKKDVIPVPMPLSFTHIPGIGGRITMQWRKLGNENGSCVDWNLFSFFLARMSRRVGRTGGRNRYI